MPIEFGFRLAGHTQAVFGTSPNKAAAMECGYGGNVSPPLCAGTNAHAGGGIPHRAGAFFRRDQAERRAIHGEVWHP